MKKPVEIEKTFRCVDVDFTHLEKTENVNWISRTQRGEIYTVKGVPSSELDVLIVPEIDTLVRIIDIGLKSGKYNGRKRRRITIRNVPYHQAPEECRGFWVDLASDNSTVIINIGNWNETHGRFRHILNSDNNLAAIVRWHFSRYYKMLSESDVEEVETNFSQQVIKGDYTLAEANRLASRLLYRAATQLGYRKLPLREQKRLGLNGQWHSEVEYAAAQNKIQKSKYSPTGCSEYTLSISNNK